MGTKMSNIEDVLRQHEQRLMSMPHVQGVAVGERGGHPVIKVLVSTKPSGGFSVPASIGGFDVVVEEIGVISAQSAEPNRETPP
jgi:hypothetical protein